MVATVNWQRGAARVEEADDLQAVIDAGGLDYRVEQVPLVTDDAAEMRISDRVANVRVEPDGERRVLGVVSRRGYEVVPNTDALKSFDQLVQQAGARYTQAGTIDYGRVAYVFAELPEPVEIIPGDPVQRSLMFTNSFDGSTPLGFVAAPVRLWCTNQVAMARRRGYGFTIRHNANAMDRAREAAKVLGQLNNAFDRITDRMKIMASMQVDGNRLKQYFESILPTPEEEGPRERVKARHDRWTERFETGIGNTGPNTRTLYHAFNAITEDVDHRHLSRRVKDPVWYATFGGGGQLKQRAWAEAERVIGVTRN